MQRRRYKKPNKKDLRSQKRFSQISEPVLDMAIEQNVSSSIPIQKQHIDIPKILTVKEFAEKVKLPVTKIIEQLFKNGVMISINESIDFDTANIIGDELGFEVQLQEEQNISDDNIINKTEKNLQSRPPIVVILGHVDHGKTTLLDKIRKSNVISTESGGITQHIGAYQVNWLDKSKNNKLITFLDTPGHEAFSAMRAHGANITDLAILVVAADDGVKPQTKEAISHAKAANIPIIVAINKIDKPDADIERVKAELADLQLINDEWGGNTTMIPISAKTGQGIEELLDMVIVTAEMQDLKADFSCPANGIVIESHMQMGVGPLATVLIQNGILHNSQIIVSNSTYGKIRRIENYAGLTISEATPAMPVRIAGFKNMPNYGNYFEVVESEKEAKTKMQSRLLRQKSLGIYDLSQKIKSGEISALNIILKTDVQGSLEAIKDSLKSLSNEDAEIKILHADVGEITENDISLAIASEALVIGFRTKPTISAKNIARMNNVKISTYSIIYQLIDDITIALKGKIEPKIIEVSQGKLEIIKIIKSIKNGYIIGGKVIDGTVSNGSVVHIIHSGEKSAEAKIISLQVGPSSVHEVEKGFECGLGVETSNTLKIGDILEAFIIEKDS